MLADTNIEVENKPQGFVLSANGFVAVVKMEISSV
jgi:hypothetical protein